MLWQDYLVGFSYKVVCAAGVVSSKQKTDTFNFQLRSYTSIVNNFYFIKNVFSVRLLAIIGTHAHLTKAIVHLYERDEPWGRITTLSSGVMAGS
jgi:hypothetical protein